LILLMEALAGGVPGVGQATTPPVERCPARFRAARDEYLAACRRRGNAEATVVTKQRAADQFLAYLDEVGRETLEQAQARDLAGFWARRQRRGYAPKTTGLLRTALADFLRHLHEDGQIREDLAGRLPPQRYPRRGQSAPHPWTAGDVRRVLEQIDRQSGAGLLEGLCAVGDDTEGVAWRVDAVVFLGEVEVPVGVEVAVADQGA
jgi:integrase/recombinase XerD